MGKPISSSLVERYGIVDPECFADSGEGHAIDGDIYKCG